MNKITKKSEETKIMGKKFSTSLKAGDVLLLYGELGAGKTTFVQGIAEGLGIKERIISPTFILQRIHDVSYREIKSLNHIDLYRLDKPTKTDSLGLVDLYEDDESVTIIEWAERLDDFYPLKGYKIYFKYIDDNKRDIKINKI